MSAAPRITFTLTLVLAGWAGASLVRAGLPPPGLAARYYSSTTFSGAPLVTGVDPTPSTDVIAHRTAGLARFSAEWHGRLAVNRAGRFVFAVTSDDGSELWVDDCLVVDNRGVHGPQEVRGEIELTRGMHAIVLRYVQYGGGMTLQVRLARAGGALAPVSPAALVPDGVSYWGFVARRAAPAGGAGLAVALFVAAGAGLRRAGPRWQRTRAARLLARAWAAAEQPRVAMGLIAASGVLARLVMLVGSGAVLWPDSDVFLYTAHQILRGELLAHDAYRTLLYPYFLAAFLAWGDTPAIGTAILAAQHALGLAAALVFYRVGRHAFGGRIALAGGLAFSVHPVLLFYEASVLTEALFVCAVSIFAATASAMLRAPTPGRAAGAGTVCALLTLVRPVGQAIILAAAVPLWWAGLPARRAAAWTMLLSAVNLAALLPWLAANQRQYGFFGVATGRGLGLFTRVFEIDRLPPAPVSAFPDVARGYEPVRSRPSSIANLVQAHLQVNLRYSTYQADEAMYGFALEAIRQQPVRFAWNSLRQWAVQLGTRCGDIRICASELGPYPCSGRMSGESRPAFPDAAAQGRPRLRRAVVRYLSAAQPPMAVIFPLALLGLVAFLIEGDRPPEARAVGLMLALSAAYLTLVPALTQWPTDRYRLPADAALLLFAAKGVAQVMAGWQDEAGGRDV